MAFLAMSSGEYLEAKINAHAVGEAKLKVNVRIS